MKQTINLYQFRDAFQRMDRGEQFSYEALEILWDWFEDLEKMDGQEIELDVIAICCDYTESSVEQLIRDYSIDCDEIEEDEIDAHVLDYLNDRTIVLGVCLDGAIVYQNF
jgi:hypothetical protein